MSTVNIIVLLFCSTVATAGTLSWQPPGPYPSKSVCQPISFDQPDAIAVDKSDNIYIANGAGPSAVQEITLTSGTIRTILDRRVEPIKSGNYSGLSLALGPKGGLFLAVSQRGTVERLNADGTLTVVAGKPGDRRLVDGAHSKARLKAPNAIAIDEDGAIYVADTRTIRKVGLDGAITTLAGNPYAENPSPVEGGSPYAVDGRGSKAVFMSPNGIAVGHDSNIYVADAYDGDVEGQAASMGILRTVTPRGIVRTVAGNIDGVSGDTDGQGGAAAFDSLFGIVINSSGDVYVTEPYAVSIRRVDPNFRVTSVIAERTGSYLSTGLNAPTAVAVTSHDTLLVVDDVAIGGIPMLSNKHVNWLHRVVGGQLQTLCGEQESAR